MARWTTEHCSRCGATWGQDWEDPPECPYCSDTDQCDNCQEPADDCTCEVDDV